MCVHVHSTAKSAMWCVLLVYACMRVWMHICGCVTAYPPHSTTLTSPPHVTTKPHKLDGISDEGIEAVKIPNGVPFVYRFDKEMQVLGTPDAVGFRSVSSVDCGHVGVRQVFIPLLVFTPRCPLR